MASDAHLVLVLRDGDLRPPGGLEQALVRWASARAKGPGEPGSGSSGIPAGLRSVGAIERQLWASLGRSASRRQSSERLTFDPNLWHRPTADHQGQIGGLGS